MEKNKCEKCEYEWIPRMKDPKTCPRCKSYDWKEKKEDEEK